MSGQYRRAKLVWGDSHRLADAALLSLVVLVGDVLMFGADVIHLRTSYPCLWLLTAMLATGLAFLAGYYPMHWIIRHAPRGKWWDWWSILVAGVLGAIGPLAARLLPEAILYLLRGT